MLKRWLWAPLALLVFFLGSSAGHFFAVPSARAMMFGGYMGGQIMGGTGYLPAAMPYCPYPVQVAPGSRNHQDQVSLLESRQKKLQEQIEKREELLKEVRDEESRQLSVLFNHFDPPWGDMISSHLAQEGVCCEYTRAEQGIAQVLSSAEQAQKVLTAFFNTHGVNVPSFQENELMSRPSRGLANIDDGGGGGGTLPFWHYRHPTSALNPDFTRLPRAEFDRDTRTYNCDAISSLPANKLTPDRFGWYYFVGNCPQREIGKYQGLPQPQGAIPRNANSAPVVSADQCWSFVVSSRGNWGGEGGLSPQQYKDLVNGQAVPGVQYTPQQMRTAFVGYYAGQCPQILKQSKVVNVRVGDGTQQEIRPLSDPLPGIPVEEYVTNQDVRFRASQLQGQGLTEAEILEQSALYASQYAGLSLIGPGVPSRHREESGGSDGPSVSSGSEPSLSASAADQGGSASGATAVDSRFRNFLMGAVGNLRKVLHRAQERAASARRDSSLNGEEDIASSGDPRDEASSDGATALLPSPPELTSSVSEGQAVPDPNDHTRSLDELRRAGQEATPSQREESSGATDGASAEDSELAEDCEQNPNLEGCEGMAVAISPNPDPQAPVVRGQCRDGSIPFPNDAHVQGHKQTWKNYCQDGGRFREGLCRNRIFSSRPTPESIRDCETALERLPDLQRRIAEMDEKIRDLEDQSYRLYGAITKAEDRRDEMEADCLDGNCGDDYPVAAAGTDWVQLLGVGAILGLGFYDMHSQNQLARTLVDERAKKGWASPVNMGYPHSTMGIYGAALAGLGSGSFGCSGGFLGGGMGGMGMGGMGMGGMGMGGMGMGGMGMGGMGMGGMGMGGMGMMGGAGLFMPGPYHPGFYGGVGMGGYMGMPYTPYFPGGSGGSGGGDSSSGGGGSLPGRETR